MDNIIFELRHELHQHPELSNHETATSERIAQFIGKLRPEKIIDIASTGKMFVFDSGKPGPTVVFRSELDALPIEELSSLPYASENNAAHSCGHDGHMSILAGLAMEISKQRPTKGKAVLLFQPAEEVEQGAHDVVNHSEFEKLNPDFVFALHNIPGAEKNRILLRQGSFAAASRGMTIKLHGKTSHAAEPENGISPANAIAELIQQMHAIVANPSHFEELTLLTIVHIRLGEIAFGTSPGEAEMMITLRAFRNNDMQKLVEETEKMVAYICKAENLSFEISYSEEFPATENNTQCVEMVDKAAREARHNIEYLKQPFRWSEDFAYYAEKYPACLFGLGAGTEQKPLHNPDYDFPDDIIESGIIVFFNIYKSLLYV